MGKSIPKNPPKDPDHEFNACRYVLDNDRDGFPSSGFKSAIVRAAKDFDGMTMVDLKSALFVEGEIGKDGKTPLVHINCPEGPISRRDMVKIAKGTTDVRFRAQYTRWSAELKITFRTSMLTMEQVLSLVLVSGDYGVGEWRPNSPMSNSGTFGRYTILEDFITASTK